MWKFNKTLFLVFVSLSLIGCNKEVVFHYDQQKAEYQDRLNAGESPFDLINEGASFAKLWGLSYGGGYIYYVSQTNDYIYVAAFFPNERLVWGCSGNSITGATGSTIGSGQTNTSAIVANCSDSNSAAKFCDDLEFNGYDDWWLPSKSELDICYDRLEQIIPKIKNYQGWSGTKEAMYWSSTQTGGSNAFIIWSNGYINDYSKSYEMGVIASRRIDD